MSHSLLSGAHTAEDIEEYLTATEDFLRTYKP
jgi:hypothetical protein